MNKKDKGGTANEQLSHALRIALIESVPFAVKTLTELAMGENASVAKKAVKTLKKHRDFISPWLSEEMKEWITQN